MLSINLFWFTLTAATSLVDNDFHLEVVLPKHLRNGCLLCLVHWRIVGLIAAIVAC